MQVKTLLLDKSYMPLDVVSWMRAVELMISGKVEVIEEYDDVPVRSQFLSFNLPSVIRLLKNIRRRRTVKFSRFNVFFRDNWKCQYCGNKFETEELTFDHVIPRSRRTPDSFKSWENIVTACMPCNQIKGGRTPEESGMRLIRKPFKPDWTPQMTLRITSSDPINWRNYIYWHAELDAT